MQGPTKKCWRDLCELCEEASVEQDPKKFYAQVYALVREIDRLLQEKELRFKQGSPSVTSRRPTA